MRKVIFSKLVNMVKQLLTQHTNNITLSIINSKGANTALKNLFLLWNNGKKKVNVTHRKTSLTMALPTSNGKF